MKEKVFLCKYVQPLNAIRVDEDILWLVNRHNSLNSIKHVHRAPTTPNPPSRQIMLLKQVPFAPIVNMGIRDTLYIIHVPERPFYITASSKYHSTASARNVLYYITLVTFYGLARFKHCGHMRAI